MRQIPTGEELNEYYSAYSYGREQYLSPLTIESYNNLLDEFEKFRKTGKILDVGCGAGFFLEQAKKRGWTAFGTEYSETAIQLCRDKGINMKEGVLDVNDFNSEEFDVVTSFEVLEHINNPMEEMKSISQLLRKDGLFYCTTPNFNSLMRYYLKSNYNVIKYPEHLTYYTKKTLNRLMRAHGMVNTKFRSHGISITRIKTSKGTSSERIIDANNSDERLRKKIQKNGYLKLVKSIVNNIFTWTNTGLTLKGYYQKKVTN
ncbi:MAG: class I SAM-dependent methyltransferase [Reichenbachiella sp.]|uniref:class I SAM-dependent methyltransferase n=1 Tax=Reichenbachiella sp. TaxID=2184521 RepID=UPI003264A2E8